MRTKSANRAISKLLSACLFLSAIVIGLPSKAAFAAVTTYQAESATLSQAVVASNHAGFTGTGFVDYNNVAGSFVEFQVSSASGGIATLTFRYANGTTSNRPMDIVIGSTVLSLPFPTTGSWSTWATQSLTLALNAGSNTVRATATTANGGPNLDKLDVDISAPTGEVQAESCTLSQVVVASNHAGFTGTGFVDYNNVAGSYVECTVSAAATGSWVLELRYANGSTTDRPMSIAVNGTVVNSNLAFPPTGAWDTWATRVINATLNAGSNTIRATATTAGGGPKLDRLRVIGDDPEPPTAPGQPSCSNIAVTSLTLTWGASTDNVGVVAYDIYHDSTKIAEAPGNVTSKDLTGLTPNFEYRLTVVARDNAGAVSPSSPLATCMTLPDTEPPTTPTNLRVINPTCNSVTITWDPSTDNVGVVAYDIYRGNVKVSTITGNPPLTRFTETGLNPSTTYTYSVRARDAAGNVSPPSNSISATTASSCGPPVGPATQVGTDTDIPWGLVTLPDGSILYSRRDVKNIVRLVPSTGAMTNVGWVPNVVAGGEGGLLGLEINPVSFATDRWLYIMHSSSTDNRVVRIKLTSSNALDLASHQVLLSGIRRGTSRNNGGRLRFSPDGQFLFIATGDAQVATFPQNPNSLNGKVLRIRPDGSIPSDNPFGNAVWSLGHRNPEGLAFDSQGRLWAHEAGNSVMDETNLIVKGGNYGWPSCEGTSGSCSDPSFIAPKKTYPVAMATCSGIAIVGNALYVACLRGTRMYRLEISGSSLINQTIHFLGAFGRLRTVEPAPGGNLWLTTSNGDDSTPNNSNNRIFRVTLGP